MTRERRLREVPAAELLAEILPLVPNLSDEEWDQRDASIQRDRDREQASCSDRLAALGFPPRALAVVRAGVDISAPMIAGIRGCSRDAEIIVLSGAKGCGKTVAATWWAARRGGTVHRVRATRFAATSRYDLETRNAWLSHPLVIDDVGVEFADSAGSFLVEFDELVDSFYDELRPLVMTTNLNLKQFRDRYGDRIADRLHECGRWISTRSGSLRKPSREASQ